MVDRAVPALPAFEEGGWLTPEQYERLRTAHQAAASATEIEEHVRRELRQIEKHARAARKHYEDLLEEFAGQLTIESAMSPEEDAP